MADIGLIGLAVMGQVRVFNSLTECATFYMVYFDQTNV